jgi:ubiquitin carboxyl-terminal hydrolase 25/28
VKQLDEYGRCPAVLQQLVVQEQSRHRFTYEDLSSAATFLGFGADNILGVEYNEETPEEVVENAWKDCVKRSWRNPQHGAQTQRLANDAFRVLSEMRGSAGASNE